MPDTAYLLGMIAVMAAMTALLRFLPFLIFSGKRQTPPFVSYLVKVLPCAAMAMLVVYCLRGISLFRGNHGLPELLSCAVVALLQLWKRNTLLSIIIGTLCYMLLIRYVFI